MNHKFKTVIIGIIIIALNMGADKECEGGGVENGKTCKKKQLSELRQEDDVCELRNIYLHAIVISTRRVGTRVEHDATGRFTSYNSVTILTNDATATSPARYTYTFEKEYGVDKRRDVSLQVSIPLLRDWMYTSRVMCEIKPSKKSILPYDVRSLAVKDFDKHNGEIQCLAEGQPG